MLCEHCWISSRLTYFILQPREKGAQRDLPVCAHDHSKAVAEPRDQVQQGCSWMAWGGGRTQLPLVFPGGGAPTFSSKALTEHWTIG